MWNSYHEERKRQKVVRCKGMKLLNSKVMKNVRKEGYTYLIWAKLNWIRSKRMK